MSEPNSTTVPSDLASVVQRFRNSHAWLIEGKPVSHGAAATDFGIAADAIEALQDEVKALQAKVRHLRIIAAHVPGRIYIEASKKAGLGLEDGK